MRLGEVQDILTIMSDAFASTCATAIPVLALAMIAGAERIGNFRKQRKIVGGGPDHPKRRAARHLIYRAYWYSVYTVSLLIIGAEFICIDVLRGTQPPNPASAAIFVEITVIALLAIVLVPLPIGMAFRRNGKMSADDEAESRSEGSKKLEDSQERLIGAIGRLEKTLTDTGRFHKGRSTNNNPRRIFHFWDH
jgi:hypothetical protein